MKPPKTKAKTRPVEPEQESYPLYCIKSDSDDLETAFQAFIEYAQGIGRSWQSIEGYKTAFGLLRRYLDERGVHNLAGLMPPVIAGFQTWLYQARSRYGRPYVLQSQINILNGIQVFGHFLAASGRLLHDPGEAIRLPKEPQRLPGTFLTPAEMKKLLRQPDTSTVLGFRDRTMYEVLYATGLRVRELTGMRVQDLNLSQSSILLPQTKHHQTRYVPLGHTARQYLTEYLNRVRPLLLRSRSTSPNLQSEIINLQSLVFLSRLGRRLDIGGVEAKLRIYAARAGIKKYLTIHVFRHTLATEMLKRGADLRQIQELLGHKNLKTTQIYTHVVQGELKRVQAHCHPREQVELPENFIRYRGRNWTRKGEQ